MLLITSHVVHEVFGSKVKNKNEKQSVLVHVWVVLLFAGSYFVTRGIDHELTGGFL